MVKSVFDEEFGSLDEEVKQTNLLKVAALLFAGYLLSTTPVNFNGQEIVPIQFLKALLPDPASLGPRDVYKRQAESRSRHSASHPRRWSQRCPAGWHGGPPPQRRPPAG